MVVYALSKWHLGRLAMSTYSHSQLIVNFRKCAVEQVEFIHLHATARIFWVFEWLG